MSVLVRTLITSLLLTVLFAGPALGQNIESQVTALASRVDEARSQNLHLIAPRAYRSAVEYLKEARGMLSDGERISDIQGVVQRGQKQLIDAGKLQGMGEVVLGDAITARTDALDARAPEFASDLWDEAEDTMTDAGREIEKGDQNDARADARDAGQRYRAAELTAIRADVLGTARDLRDKAREADADEWAQQTWQDAESKLREAEQILEGDRYNRSQSRELARAAGRQYQHAILIAETAERIDDDTERRVEETLLRYESEMGRIAGALGTDVAFAEGLEPVAERLVASVTSLQEDRSNLQASLEERRLRIDRLERRIDSLGARLAELGEREESISAELRQKRERERALKQVRDIFSASEAEVLLRGNELILRMQGLNFPVGSSEIRPANFSLLTKVQRVLREFPEGAVTIAGHTDAQGRDATNQKLSEERAQAVREYLLANMDAEPTRLTSIGYGESQPLASNETTEGRSQNRRIDVTVALP